jgi:hypothetical protein
MKRFVKFTCLIVAVLMLFSVGCQKQNPLYDAVSELRSDIFVGKSQSFDVKACYGFKETPYANDATVGGKVFSIIFKLINADTQALHTIKAKLNGQEYSSDFKLNPVTGSLTAVFEIENFAEKEFLVTVNKAELCEEITLYSIVPDNTIDYKKALDYFKEEQAQLISAYTDEKTGKFNAEIHIRIVVKNDKPYYYIGIATGNGNLKALLIDGITGKTLAIREIF